MALIVRTSKILFRMKFTLDSEMPTALATYRIVYLPSLSVISLALETLVNPVAVTGRPDFAESLTVSVQVTNLFFHLPPVT